MTSFNFETTFKPKMIIPAPIIAILATRVFSMPLTNPYVRVAFGVGRFGLCSACCAGNNYTAH